MSRTDRRLVTTGRRAAIRCPNASHIGYCKWVAEPGDLVSFDTGDGNRHLGRVVGRVDAAGGPDNGEPVKAWLCVVMLSEEGTFAYEVWVNPAWVQSIHKVTDGMVRFFTSWLTADPTKLLAMGEYGSLTSYGSCTLPDYKTA